MNIEKALQKFQDMESLIVGGTTFETEGIDEIRLETGESIYWVKDGGDVWLSLDPQSEEIILFTVIEDEIDYSGETVVYRGDDWEFEYESEAMIVEDGEETDEIMFRDFEGPNGRVLRVVENMVTGDISASVGEKVTEDDIQEE